MQVLENILGEIKAFKRKVVSENQDYQKGYLCALSYVEGVIAEHMNEGKDADVPTNGWIPCSERLPESYVDVLVDFGDDSPVIAYYCCMNNADIWRNSSTDKIIHIDVLAWQKLSEPYKLSEPKTMKNTQ